ncbi:hypothetical protein RF11_06693 [Thelohanellus kitauei]|uniref:Uncharacterized protein n=1 Tax=Thelohanellus kitauei TaxID=669202 RepID=A0A0C2MPJ7_THEKT|nr:hypothetical protein RF11_06693 [Thelohanellus kitauei]
MLSRKYDFLLDRNLSFPAHSLFLSENEDILLNKDWQRSIKGQWEYDSNGKRPMGCAKKAQQTFVFPMYHMGNHFKYPILCKYFHETLLGIPWDGTSTNMMGWEWDSKICHIANLSYS